MPTITKITKQKKANDRYNIFLDGTYAFSVTEDVFIQYNLHKGLSLSDEDVKEIIDDDTWQQTYLQVIHFLSYRMRTEQEILTYLKKKEVDSKTIAKIIDKLKEEKYINDSEFANVFVRDRMNQSSKGPILIMKELREKGISQHIAKEAVEQYSDEKQVETAMKWAKKQLNKRSNQSYHKQMEQLKVKLIQKGFANAIAYSVIEKVKPPKDEEAEQIALKVQADKLYKKHSRRYQGYELKMKLKEALYRRGFDGELIDAYIVELETLNDGKG